MSFFNRIKGKIAEEKKIKIIGEATSFSTGIGLVDLHNSTVSKRDGVFNPGITSGRIMTIVGPSGSAKTTLSLQAANNLVRDRDGKVMQGAGIIHFDAERATRIERVQNLFDESAEDLEEYYQLLNGDGITIENFFETVKMIADMKRDSEDELMIEYEDQNGNVVDTLPPTVVILDTLAMLMPDTITETDELSGQMIGSRTAMRNNQMLKRLNGPLAQYNIILIIINHLTTKVSINPMQPVRKDINYLRQGENMPGGSASYYLSDYMIRLEAGKNLDPEKDFGIKGFIVRADVIKSRGQPAGLRFELVYDQDRGFRDDMSNYLFLYENKRFKGSPRSHYIDGLEDVKFTRKTFSKKLAESEELQKRYHEVLKEEHEKYLGLVEEE